MTRSILTAALAAALLAAPAQARLVKELQVVRTGKLVMDEEGQTKVFKLVTDNKKVVVLGDREFFPQATQAALDQAVDRKLDVSVTGQMLIFNDRAPVFSLPVAKLDVKDLDMDAPAAHPAQTPSSAIPEARADMAAQPEAKPDVTPKPQEEPAAQQAAVDKPAPTSNASPAPVKDSMLKAFPGSTVGKALDGYAYFSSRQWQVVEPGKVAFTGTFDLSAITAEDSRYIPRLRTQDLGKVFKSITFSATLTLRDGGIVDSTEPVVDAVFEDGMKDRLIWKDPPNYYWDRIYRNRKIKFDYFLSKAALSPKYGKGMGPGGQ